MHRPLKTRRMRRGARLQRAVSRAGICYESRVTNGRIEPEKAGENRGEGGGGRGESAIDKGRETRERLSPTGRSGREIATAEEGPAAKETEGLKTVAEKIRRRGRGIDEKGREKDRER